MGLAFCELLLQLLKVGTCVKQLAREGVFGFRMKDGCCSIPEPTTYLSWLPVASA